MAYDPPVRSGTYGTCGTCGNSCRSAGESLQLAGKDVSLQFPGLDSGFTNTAAIFDRVNVLQHILPQFHVSSHVSGSSKIASSGSVFLIVTFNISAAF